MRTSAVKICRILQEHGFQAVFAGGCVRDMLLGIDCHDIDIATSATPTEVMSIFNRTVPVGVSFGVVRVHMNGFEFEVATFRTDSKTSDGRRPDSVEFSSMGEDAKRRDLTINAIFYDPIAEKTYDFVGGLYDLEGKIIRFVGNPWERLEEDQLRALRAVRFSAKFNFVMEYDASRALKGAKLSSISPERIKDEFEKILLLENCVSAIRMLFDFGLLEQFLPEVVALNSARHSEKWHPEGNPFVHSLIVLEKTRERTSDVNALWGALLHDIGKPLVEKEIDGRITSHGHDEVGAKLAVDILKRLRASNSQIEEVEFIVSQHMRIKLAGEMSKSKLSRLKAEKHYENLKIVSMCDSMSTGLDGMLDWVDALDKVEEFKELPKPLVNGYDLITLGVLPGHRMGVILECLMDFQLEGMFGSKDDAIRFVKDVILSPSSGGVSR